jgi:hypothetical protein
MKSRSKRMAKLHSRWRPGMITFGNNFNSGKYVPWLNLNGQWLAQAGFGIGDRIEIDVRQNELVIRKVPVKSSRTKVLNK